MTELLIRRALAHLSCVNIDAHNIISLGTCQNCVPASGDVGVVYEVISSDGQLAEFNPIPAVNPTVQAGDDVLTILKKEGKLSGVRVETEWCT